MYNRPPTKKVTPPKQNLLDDLKERIGDLKEQIDELELSKADKHSIATVETSVDNLTTRLQSVNNFINSVGGSITGIESSITDIESSINEKIELNTYAVEMTSQQCDQNSNNILSIQTSLGNLSSNLDASNTTVNEHIANTNNPHSLVGNSIPVGGQDTRSIIKYADDLVEKEISELKEYVDNKNVYILVFDSISIFKSFNNNTTNLVYNPTTNTTTLANITSENSSTNEPFMGLIIKFREKNVSDYFVSKLTVEGESTNILNFLDEEEAHVNIVDTDLIKNTDLATKNKAGIVKIGKGISVNNGVISVKERQSVNLTYGTLNEFLSDVHYHKEEDANLYVLDSIAYLSVDDLGYGSTILIREQSTPDYWLARTIISSEQQDPVGLAFFETIQGERPIVIVDATPTVTISQLKELENKNTVLRHNDMYYEQYLNINGFIYYYCVDAVNNELRSVVINKSSRAWSEITHSLVSNNLTINNKPLSSDIALTLDDIPNGINRSLVNNLFLTEDLDLTGNLSYGQIREKIKFITAANGEKQGWVLCVAKYKYNNNIYRGLAFIKAIEAPLDSISADINYSIIHSVDGSVDLCYGSVNNLTEINYVEINVNPAQRTPLRLDHLIGTLSNYFDTKNQVDAKINNYAFTLIDEHNKDVNSIKRKVQDLEAKVNINTDSVISEDHFYSRQTAEGIDIIDGALAEVKCLGGYSQKVVQEVNLQRLNNQTINGVTFTFDKENGTITLNGTATDPVFSPRISNRVLTVGHKYLLYGCPIGESWKNYLMYYNEGGSIDTGQGAISNALNVDTGLHIYVDNGYTCNNLVFKPQLFDLTEMGLASISSVQEFKALFLKDYYEYGSYILNAKVDKVVSEGSNKFSGVNWVKDKNISIINGIDIYSNNDNNACLDYVKVKPNTNYYYGDDKTEMQIILFYDFDKNYLSYIGTKSFTTPSNCAFIRVYNYAAGGSELPTQVMVNEGSIALPYKSYVVQTELPIPQEIQELDGYGFGLSKTDKSLMNYWEDGKFVQNIGVVDLGTLNWTYSQSVKAFSVPKNQDMASVVSGQVANMLSSDYKVVVASNIVNDAIANNMCVGLGGNDVLWISNQNYTDPTALKQSLQGVKLYYQLATPVITEVPFDSTYFAYDKGTETLVNEDKVAAFTEMQYAIEKGE